MSFPGFKGEYKRIGVVWILNLIPPCSGFGTIYAYGPKAIWFVVLCWFYLSLNHTSVDSLINTYMVLSIAGTIGAVMHNISLSEKLGKSREDDGNRGIELDSSIARIDQFNQSEDTSEYFALDSFEKKIADAEAMLKQKGAKTKEVSNINSGGKIIIPEQNKKTAFSSPGSISASASNAVPVEEEALRNLFSEDEISKDLNSISEIEVKAEPAILSSKLVVDEKTTFEIEKKPVVEKVVIQKSVVENAGLPEKPLVEKVVAEKTAAEQPKAVLPEEPEFDKQKVDGLLNKMGDATGEFQPAGETQQLLENYDFSAPAGYDLDSFKFDLPTSFDTSFELANQTSASSGQSKCAECGAEINSSFSFCLSCGKNF